MILAREEYPGGRAFEVVTGNLLEEPTDAIVNAANGHLAHGGGVAAAIARAAGPALEEECFGQASDRPSRHERGWATVCSRGGRSSPPSGNGPHVGSTSSADASGRLRVRQRGHDPPLLLRAEACSRRSPPAGWATISGGEEVSGWPRGRCRSSRSARPSP